MKASLFQKGKSGNPSGRPKTPKELKDCTPTQIRLMIWELWKMRSKEVERVANDEDAPAGQRMIASVISKAIKRGDPARLESLTARLVGRVKEVVEIEGNMTFTLPSREEALQMLNRDFAMLPPKEIEVEVEDV